MAFSGYQDLDPRFASALQSLIAASPYGISPFSGYRSIERQRQLWEASDRSGHMVARPGHSQHNFGRAVDLHYGDPAASQWAHANAQQYGLTFPMSYEPWHIEPIGARGGPVPQGEPQASQSGQAPGFPQQPMPMPAPANSFADIYGRAIFGGGDDDWLQNRSYSFDALAADFFAGRNPLRRFIYQKLFG
jgi:hypothetical protein